jgi:flavin reductase (DIM6/NTAB) family NADH-FMN oxidoreductase RutF
MLASWIQQCSFTPPMLSVAIKQGRDVVGLLTDGAVFTVNILESNQTDMIAHFGRGFALDEPAFEGLDVQDSGQGGPVLSEALAFLDCQLADAYPTGDHLLMVARIVNGQVLSEGQPLVHVRKNGMHY